MPEFFGHDLYYWIDLGGASLVVAAVLVILFKYAKRKLHILWFALGACAFFASYLFFANIDGVTGLLPGVIGIVLALSIVVYLFVNSADVRPLFGRSSHKGKNGKNDVQRIFDREALYDAITETVSFLSRTKTGAIMTFERKMPLTDMIKNGVTINAPVTPELLMTIFYPGTRLHDGAVVIRDSTIVVASAFYTPTTKPLAGKYGSRHRAAIGISEVSDSVTVVVSEETGRISIAYGGELEPIFIDNFHRIFEEYMEDTTYVDEKESV